MNNPNCLLENMEAMSEESEVINAIKMFEHATCVSFPRSLIAKVYTLILLEEYPNQLALGAVYLLGRAHGIRYERKRRREKLFKVK